MDGNTETDSQEGEQPTCIYGTQVNVFHYTAGFILKSLYFTPQSETNQKTCSHFRNKRSKENTFSCAKPRPSLAIKLANTYQALTAS